MLAGRVCPVLIGSDDELRAEGILLHRIYTIVVSCRGYDHYGSPSRTDQEQCGGNGPMMKVDLGTLGLFPSIDMQSTIMLRGQSRKWRILHVFAGRTK